MHCSLQAAAPCIEQEDIAAKVRRINYKLEESRFSELAKRWVRFILITIVIVDIRFVVIRVVDQ